jgi:tetratricopeptide (TPR) repeat protein
MSLAFYNARRRLLSRPMRRLPIVAICIASMSWSASPSDAQAHLGEGLRLFGLQRYAEAAREFQLALKYDPNLRDARYHLAVSYFEQHQYPESSREFRRLKASGYQAAWVTYYLGRLDLVDGDWDAAIRQFQSLKRSQPLQDELYYLGFALLKRDQPDRAIPALRRQIQFNPRDFRAHNLLARAYMKAGQSKEAEREFQRSEDLHQYYREGKEDLDACRSDLAADRADQAWARCGAALESDDIDKLVAVGSLFGSFQDYPHALDALERARLLDPDSPEVNYNIGFTYFQEKQYSRARSFLESALRERPDFFEALEVEGTALCRLGESSAARPVLERAHALRPGDPAVTELLAQLNGRDQR